MSFTAAAALSAANLNSQSTNNQYLSAVTCSAAASVIKQYTSSHSSSLYRSGSPPSVSSDGLVSQPNKNRRIDNYDRSGILPTTKYPSNMCEKFRHWSGNYPADGLLPLCVKIFNQRQEFNMLVPSSGSAFLSAYGSRSASTDSDKKETVLFNNDNFASSPDDLTPLCPLFNSAVPYYAIGFLELNVLADHFGLSLNPPLSPIPKSLDGCTRWQCNAVAQTSPPRKILGAIELTAITDNGNALCISPVVLDAWPQWVIGRNVASRINIRNVRRCAFFLKEGMALSRLSAVFFSHLSSSLASIRRRSLSKAHLSALPLSFYAF